MGYLDPIVASTRVRVQQLRTMTSEDTFEQRIAGIEPARSLVAALGGPGMAIIAEIKRRSPSAGPLRLELDAAALARSYAEGGAAAISVLTEPEHFEGSLEDMGAACGAGLPVLRKDFIIDPLQLLESRAAGADSVLLIVRILGDELTSFVPAARALGMEPLVEVHDERDLARALEAGARIIGVNHRDLETFEVDPARTATLAPLIPEDSVLVSLSGVDSAEEVAALASAGADAVLIGESLVVSEDPVGKLRELQVETATSVRGARR